MTISRLNFVATAMKTTSASKIKQAAAKNSPLPSFPSTTFVFTTDHKVDLIVVAILAIAFFGAAVLLYAMGY